MMHNKEYLSDVLVRLAHHSSAIEGNTISLPETVTIIVEGTMPGSHKSIREFFEIENHKRAFSLVLDILEEGAPLSMSAILSLHAALTDRLQYDSGKFKRSQNAIVGADFKTASPEQVPYLMEQWIENTVFRLENSQLETDIIQVLADTHIQFERVHPFSDGNGRIGRLLLVLLSFRYLDVPVIIERQDRGAYIEALAGQDVGALLSLFSDKIKEEKERQARF